MCDLCRGDETLPRRCPGEVLSGANGNCIEPDLALLIGEGAADGALNVTGKRGACSKKLPGCKELLVCWDRLEEALDVFLRSWFGPALKETRSGDDGPGEPLLGDEFD